MKTEDFDEAFRRKLDSLEPPFAEGDVESVHRYVLDKQAGRSSFKIRMFSALSVLLLVAAGLLSWNLIQMNENKELLQKNSGLMDSLVKVKELLGQNAAPIRDTVYLAEYIDPKQELSTATQGVNYKSPATYPENAKEKPNDNSKSNNAGSDKNKELITGTANGSNGNENKQMMQSQITGNDLQSNNLKKGIQDEFKQDSDELGSDKNVSVDKKNHLQTGKDSLKDELANASDSAIKITPKNVNIASVATDNDTSAASSLNENSPAQSKFDFNIGINAEKANSQFGFGLIGEVLYGKRWSLTTGAKLLRIYNETYDDDDEYRNKNGRDFIDTYAPNSPDSVRASDIDFKYSVLQIPLAINYRLPVGNHFSVLFSAGTDIDLYAKKSIRYEYRSYGERERRKSESDAPVAAFNNMVLAVGIQRQFGRFPVQLSPFISPQLKNTDYKKQNLFYGIRLRILYNI